MSQKLSFIITRPGGNDTALFVGIPHSLEEKKSINDTIMNIYPTVEQVGFVNLDHKQAELQMAGGEFCGNATRATAWQILRGKPGIIEIAVSGVDKKLKAGITEEGEAYAQIPVYPDPTKILKDSENGNYTVEMEGITHYIDFDASQIENLTPQEIKEKGFEAIKKRGLHMCPAAGIIYTKTTDDGVEITPIVYVRDADTLFYETACGSGTAAVGLACTIANGRGVTNFPVLQPSGYQIKVSVEYDGDRIGYTQIQGPISNLYVGTLEMGKEGAYAIERITIAESLAEALSSGGLQILYAKIFSEAPYYESFEEDEIKDTFSKYVTKGMLFLVKDKGKVIGFGAALPLRSEPQVVETISKSDSTIDINTSWYMSDLGVHSEYRGRGIAEKLVLRRIESMPQGTTVVMRTSLQNIPSLLLYQKLGFTQIEGAFQEVEQKRTDGTTYSDKRIFLVRRGSNLSESNLVI